MPSRTKERRIILFGRYPIPGQTKTRLIPALGALGAAELQRRLTERTIATLLKTHVAPVDFAYTGGTEHQMQRWVQNTKVHLVAQPDGDLGHRMQKLIYDAFARGAQEVVLVGTDIPDLNPGHLAEAFDALATNDVVLGPSKDGGYWLVGCKKAVDLFRDIPWSTPEVLPQTLLRTKKLGLETALLKPLNDMDTPDDLVIWRPDRSWQRPYLSVVIPTLNEAANIMQTIDNIAVDGVEIIVADGGSRDGTAMVARDAGVKVVQTRRGRAGQQNEGARLALGRVLLFLHADTRLPQDYDKQIFDLFMDPHIILGAFRFKTSYHSCAMKMVERSANLRARWLNMPYGDQALFMRKTVFDRVGGFPDVPIAEDLFLVKTLASMGRIAMTDGAAVTSGRRWQKIGVVRTTAVNVIIAAGCLLGISPTRLAPLYRQRRKTRGIEELNNG